VFFLGPLSLVRRVPSLAILGALVYVIVSGAQVVKASHLSTAVDATPPAQAIVLLSAPAPNGQPGATLTGRLQEALLLYRAHRAPQLLISDPATSPVTTATPNAASVATHWLESQGVPASKVTVLPAGGAVSAFQSTAALLGPQAHVIVVADAIDALFTRDAADAAGLSATVSPAVGSEQPIYGQVVPLVKQATGVAVGRVAGYGRASWASP
jgi:uncharacterized SAM-binding protein YcdF (DUF218 family)